MKQIIPISDITRSTIADNFTPTRGYTISEIRKRLHLHARLKDDKVLETLGEICYIAPYKRKKCERMGTNEPRYTLQPKPEVSYMDCIRHKIIQYTHNDENVYCTYNQLSQILYGMDIKEMELDDDPVWYSTFSAQVKKEAKEIVNNNTIRMSLGSVIQKLGKTKGTTIQRVHLIEVDNGSRFSDAQETVAIDSIMRKMSWNQKGHEQKFRTAMLDVNEKVLANKGKYQCAAYSFKLKDPHLTISEEEIDMRIRLHLYKRLVAKYYSKGTYNMRTKEVVNRWGRYQLGLGKDFSYANAKFR